MATQRGEAASPDHRLFFALQPDTPTAERMGRIAEQARRRHGPGGRPTAAPRLHLSLNFVGSFRGPPPRAVIDKARAVASEVAHPPFVIALDRVESWKGDPHPLVLVGGDGVIGVEALHGAIHRTMAAAGMAPRREPQFWAHVTLLRDRREAPAEPIEPVSWTVREFVLIDSVFGEGRHELLGRWRLNAAAA
ncbi:MAG: 2'-5' RNA ligase family protein [Phenylobacterium sp.]